MQAFKHFLLAVQFFSRVPVSGRLAEWVGWSPAMQRASAAHLPGVGWLVGLLAGAVVLLCHALWGAHAYGPWLAALCSTLATLAVTGAFHEDGMADVADGLGGHLPAERALEVMKDSRLGSYGVIALCMGLMVKLVLVASLVHSHVAAAALLLCCIHVLSRAAPLALMRCLPNVRRDASSKTLHIAGDRLTGRQLFTACLWCVPAWVALLAYTGWALPLLITVTGALVTAYMGWRFHQRLGGMTGDCLGATQQVCELTMYAASLALLAQWSV
ncbi:MAG: adenosylcobinamide-GDP ribazoletransferase [Comamonas sp.]